MKIYDSFNQYSLTIIPYVVSYISPYKYIITVCQCKNVILLIFKRYPKARVEKMGKLSSFYVEISSVCVVLHLHGSFVRLRFGH